MGRGLSELQRSILTMAYRNRVDDPEPRASVERVVLNVRPGDPDPRRVVPEAFERWPDGLWLERGAADCHFLVVETEPWSPDAEARAKGRVADLLRRNLPAWRRTVLRGYVRDLYAHEVLTSVYGLTPRLPATSPPAEFPAGIVLRDGHGGQHLRLTADGRDRYNAATASVSRAVRRLVERGLLAGGWGAADLTDEGMVAAEEITANTRDN